MWSRHSPLHLQNSPPITGLDIRCLDRLCPQPLVTPGHKLTVHLPEGEGELYDLRADPEERVNLWRQAGQQELARRLLCQLLRGRAGLEAPVTPRAAYA